MEGFAAVSQQIWDMKYRLKSPEGEAVDKTVEDSWRRVAQAVASIEAEPQRWEPVFYEALRDFAFLPAGRILAGAGTGRKVTLFNCFVMGTIPDDMSGIFEHLREAALTMQQGGGIGYDFSTIRPQGARVLGVGADASGPLSFMDVWDSMCRTIMSAGYRRGAMMATLRCDHPDIEAFIDAKRDKARLRNFNLSVLVTDAFMAAVEQDAPWPLVFGGERFRTLPARELWARIMRATYDYAEPGVIFIDRINARNNLAYCETIAATNPCGEQPLPPYGACLLGSINLARLVIEPFESEARLDFDRLRHLVGVAVRMMDNVVDLSQFPLPAQAEEARNKRRIGLGVTGLADALIFCGLRYGSSEAVAAAEHWLEILRDAAYAASVELAREKGAFPLFEAEPYLAGGTALELSDELRAGIREHGIRNALLTSIAPTGTISLLADNISSGIEPVFSFSHTRRVRLPDGSSREESVSDFAYRLFRRLKGEAAELPPAFVDAQGLTPHDHLVMQASAQKYIDSSISKTINLPESIGFDAFEHIYRAAYESGCKGCTTYRPNEVTGSVLTATPAAATPSTSVPVSSLASAALPEADSDEIAARPPALQGCTYKLRWPESDHALYITVNDLVEDGQHRPFEVFINSKNMDHYAWTVGLTRMISAVFRRGGDVGFVVEELKAVFDPRGGAWIDGRYVPSLLAAIGGIIEQHLRAIGFLGPKIGMQGTRVAETCPRCGSQTLTRQEGCVQCSHCGYSKCG